MKDQLIAKIRRELDRGITTESQVVYVLVELRKLLDRNREHAKPYDSIRLYSDWVVHIRLNGPQAQEIVKKADAFYPKLIEGSMSEDEKADFARIFSLDTFRKELNQFLEVKELRPFSNTEWNSFLACFLNVIEDCPLFCEAKGATVTQVDEVVVVRDLDRIPDDSPPPVIWALSFGGKFRMSVGGDFTHEKRISNAIVAFNEARDQ
jgi:hypothetical protein